MFFPDCVNISGLPSGWSWLKTHNNLFIFDWDNTLFPTTFLTKEEIIDNNLPEKYIEIFSILEKSIIKIFNLAIDKGDVYIKIRVELLATYGNHTVFIMSFHYAERPFTVSDFPYFKKG